MSAKIIDGDAVASKIIDGIKRDITKLEEKGLQPHLKAVQVGENAASRVYIKNQKKSCEEIGIEYSLDELPYETSEQDLISHIQKLNNDKSVTGIILQMPVPPAINARTIQSIIHPDKDVEGLNPVNFGKLFYYVPFGPVELTQNWKYLPHDMLKKSYQPILGPCTALGAVELIKSTGVPIEGANVTVVGHSEIVGKPIAMLLLSLFATTTVCHIATKNLKERTLSADILVVAVGKPGLITADMIKPGACVIDVGINRIKVLDENGQPVLNKKGKPKKKTVGDVDYDKACEVAGYITPVPGGVGPMTVAMLLKNTVEAAKKQL